MVDSDFISDALAPSASIASRMALYCVVNFVLGFAAGLFVARFQKPSEKSGDSVATEAIPLNTSLTTEDTSLLPQSSSEAAAIPQSLNTDDAGASEADVRTQSSTTDGPKPSGAQPTSVSNQESLPTQSETQSDLQDESSISAEGPKTEESNDKPQVRVKQLTIYPVKACAGVNVESARLVSTGLEHDRRFMVVDFTGRNLTQRKYPTLALARPSVLENGDILLEGPDVASVRFSPVSRGTKVVVTANGVKCDAVDQGDEPAAFFANFLEIAGVRVVGMRDGFSRQSGDGDFQTSFADVYPFLMASDASRRQVEEWAGRPVDIRRFRPNIVVDDDSLSAFDEDSWDHVQMGSCKFLVPKGCTRCTVVNVDPDTGVADDDGAVLNALRNHRRFGDNIIFGQNVVAELDKDRSKNVIHVGDAITVIDRKSDVQKPDTVD